MDEARKAGVHRGAVMREMYQLAEAEEPERVEMV